MTVEAVNSSFNGLAMNSTQNPSSDWMLLIAGLLIATLVAAVMSPQAELDASVVGDYPLEQAISE